MFQERVVRPIARSLAERRKLRQRHHLLLTRGRGGASSGDGGGGGSAGAGGGSKGETKEEEGQAEEPHQQRSTSAGPSATASASASGSSSSSSASNFESIEITAAGLSILRDLHQQVINTITISITIRNPNNRSPQRSPPPPSRDAYVIYAYISP